MSGGSWHLVDAAGLGPGETRAVRVAGRHLLLCHAEGRVWAIDDECPHASIPLDGGQLRGCILECPLHGGRIDVRSGEPTALPISDAVAIYLVRETPDGLEVQIPE